MMTFKLEGFVSKIKSPIVLVIEGSEQFFESGAELAAHNFSRRYSITSLYAKDNKIVIEAIETNNNEPFNYSGEAAILKCGGSN